jgi:hypothetical protein
MPAGIDVSINHQGGRGYYTKWQGDGEERKVETQMEMRRENHSNTGPGQRTGQLHGDDDKPRASHIGAEEASAQDTHVDAVAPESIDFK